MPNDDTNFLPRGHVLDDNDLNRNSPCNMTSYVPHAFHKQWFKKGRIHSKLQIFFTNLNNSKAFER